MNRSCPPWWWWQFPSHPGWEPEGAAPPLNGPGVTSFNHRTGAVTLMLNDVHAVGGALLDSPVFTGIPRAPLPRGGDSSDQIATTSFVAGSIALATAPLAGISSPNFTGTPTAPTPVTADNSDRIATTEFVQTIAAGGSTAFLPITGGTLTGNLIIVPPAGADTVMALQKSGAAANNVIYGMLNATTPRWRIILGDGSAEIGNDAGTNFVITKINDIGIPEDVMAISRATGVCTFSQQISQPSDIRLKNITGEYDHGLYQIEKLFPVRFSRNENGGGREQIGLIAQDCETVLPEIVVSGPGFISGKPVDDMRGLQTGALVFALINAVKELAQRVRMLEEVTHE